jgi:hypothetical protein
MDITMESLDNELRIRGMLAKSIIQVMENDRDYSQNLIGEDLYKELKDKECLMHWWVVKLYAISLILQSDGGVITVNGLDFNGDDDDREWFRYIENGHEGVPTIVFRPSVSGWRPDLLEISCSNQVKMECPRCQMYDTDDFMSSDDLCQDCEDEDNEIYDDE